jgi:hypothetical protein
LAVARTHGTKACRRFRQAFGGNRREPHMNLLPEPIAISHEIRTYTELQRQIHDDLRIQHPEWVGPNGECRTCDSYEARLRELLDTLTWMESNESIAVTPRPLDQALN